jgi:hypothetical protein
MRKYNRPGRREAMEAIEALFLKELDQVRGMSRRTVDAAWRRAVENWLLSEGIITIKNPKSVTHLSVKAVS